MHSGIEEGEETAVTSSDEPGKVWPCQSITNGIVSCLLCSKPTLKRHDSVVIDVEEREMGVLFLGDKEERVEHVEELGHVEQPGHVQGPEGLGMVGVVDGLTGPIVVASDVKSTE